MSNTVHINKTETQEKCGVGWGVCAVQFPFNHVNELPNCRKQYSHLPLPVSLQNSFSRKHTQLSNPSHLLSTCLIRNKRKDKVIFGGKNTGLCSEILLENKNASDIYQNHKLTLQKEKRRQLTRQRLIWFCLIFSPQRHIHVFCQSKPGITSQVYHP